MGISAETPSEGFPPIAAPGIHTLILGSLPSQQSLEKQEYYGNPQNAFWRIMGELFDAGPDVPYPDRTPRLTAHGVGVWDVLRSSVRPGSLDADIDLATATANDFPGFLRRQPSVSRICFNGRKAGELFRRFDCLADAPTERVIALIPLPSTSPAYASMSYQDKLTRWVIVGTPPEA